MTHRWHSGSHPSRLLAQGDFAAQAYAALKRWYAFRGARGGVSFERFRAALVGIDGPSLDGLASVSIDLFDLEAHGDRLLSIFRQLEDLKHTRTKWTASSKALYLLLPDLVVPMDRSTWRFLGRAVPVGLYEEDFLLAYSTFSIIARAADVGGRLRMLTAPRQDTVQLGLARVIDFALLGWMQDREG